MDSTEEADGQPLNLSTLSAVNLGRGGGMHGGAPDGSFGGGQSGEMPQMPGGGFPDGEMPQIPGGNFPDGDMPQLPGRDFEDGDTPQMPGGDFQNGGNRRGDQFTQWGQGQDRTQDGAAGETAVVSPGVFLSVGISVLFLLAGIVIAFKVKH